MNKAIKNVRMKVKNIFTVTVPVLMLTVLFGSCIRENIIYVDDVTSRTVFVYMAADNNLNGYVDDNINQMKMSVSKMPYKANLIVYVDRLKAKPMLLNVKFEKIDTIKVFPELNSSSADTFEMIFREVKHRWPADKYGLLMWSHGTGWIPKSQLHNVAWNLGYAPARDGRQALSPIYERIPDIRDPFAPTKTFGFERDANGNYLCIELDELAAVIPDKEFEFIIFDACYMGCVEVAYALRNKTEYFVSSSVEILGQGFPYYETTPFMMEGDMNNVCKKFFEHYDRKSGWERTGGISLVKTAELDKLASSFNKIVAQWPDSIDINESSLQCFDRFSGHHTFFDMVDVAEHMCSDPTLLNEFLFQTERCIKYAASTPYVLEGDPLQIAIDKYCGLSMYFPFTYNKALNEEYRKTSWSVATGL